MNQIPVFVEWDVRLQVMEMDAESTIQDVMDAITDLGCYYVRGVRWETIGWVVLVKPLEKRHESR